MVTLVDIKFGQACSLLLRRLGLPQTEVGLVVTLVDTKFGLVCSLLLRRLRLPVVGNKSNP